MHLYILLDLLYIAKNKNVPTYLEQVLAYNPIKLNFGVFHIVKFLIFETLEPILINTIREASTAFAASIN